MLMLLGDGHKRHKRHKKLKFLREFNDISIFR